MATSHPNVEAGLDTEAIADALKKNIEAAAAVEDVADQLGLMHAELSTKIAESCFDCNIDGAVQRTQRLEEKLSQTVEKMDEVNQAIEAQHASLTHLSKAN